MAKKVAICTPPKPLTRAQSIRAAQRAIEINPVNAPRHGPEVMEPLRLAVITTKWWGAGGIKLTVGFMEPTAVDLRERILSHMNAWSKVCNVSFAWTQTAPQVRISRGSGGYWSYLGTDILGIPRTQPTMNLEAFTMNTPESEFVRVVRHETGHTLGMPHEHMRRELVALIDPNKAIEYFQQTQGWSADMVRQQVLTPLDEASLMGTEHADASSVMSYQIPGKITKDGKPIIGGTDIDAADAAFAGRVYPLPVVPPPPSATTIVIPKAGTWQLIS